MCTCCVYVWNVCFLIELEHLCVSLHLYALTHHTNMKNFLARFNLMWENCEVQLLGPLGWLVFDRNHVIRWQLFEVFPVGSQLQGDCKFCWMLVNFDIFGFHFVHKLYLLYMYVCMWMRNICWKKVDVHSWVSLCACMYVFRGNGSLVDPMLTCEREVCLYGNNY